MYGNIVLLALFLLSSIVPGVEPDAAHCFSAKGYLIMDFPAVCGVLLFPAGDDFHPVRESVERPQM